MEDDEITTPQITNNTSSVTGFISQHFILIGVSVLVVLYLVYKFKSKTSTTTTTPATGDLSGLSTDANGNPIIYRDTADSFYNYSSITDSNNVSASNNVTDTSTTSISTTPIIQGTPPITSKPVTQPTKPPTASKGSWSCNYAVKSGDTLSSIASSYGTDWHTMYSHNTSTIDTTSHAHGNPIPGGTWNNIFPGEVLVVPCK